MWVITTLGTRVNLAIHSKISSDLYANPSGKDSVQVTADSPDGSSTMLAQYDVPRGRGQALLRELLDLVDTALTSSDLIDLNGRA